jgi:Tfp pilus assembly protein FimT
MLVFRFLPAEQSDKPRRMGYTLLEVMVVLILLTLASAVVVPSLLTRVPNDSNSLQRVVANAREAAVRRGELVRLSIDRSGAWQATAGTLPVTDILMSGRLSDTRGSVELLFSPLGTCGPSAEDALIEGGVTLDPLSCEVRSK